MQVLDGGSPARFNETVVRVDVTRNFHRATFTPSPRYEATVEESVAFGTELITVSAKDEDREVS